MSNEQIQIDERLLVLIETAESLIETAKIEQQKANELIEKNEQLAKDLCNDFDKRTRDTNNFIEKLSNRVISENLITKNEIQNEIKKAVLSHFVEHLSFQLSNETKKQIKHDLDNVLNDCLKQSIEKEINALTSSLNTSKLDMISISDETRKIINRINEQLEAGSKEIVHNGIQQINAGTKQLIYDFNNTINNLNIVAKKSEAKTKYFREMIDNLDKVVKSRNYNFLLYFCLIFLIFCLVSFLIMFAVLVPNQSERNALENEISKLRTQYTYMQNDRNMSQMKYIQNQTYIRVDKRDCEKDYCRIKMPQEK